MITKTQKTKLYKRLKGDWIDDVLKDLNDRGIKNRDGKTYSVSMVRHVISGRNENPEIETSILNIYKAYDKAAKALERRKQKLLSE